jgi:hypothetical protein
MGRAITMVSAYLEIRLSSFFMLLHCVASYFSNQGGAQPKEARDVSCSPLQ